MKTVVIQLKNHFEPTTYSNVDEFYDCFGWIEIVQNDTYKDIKTKIRKAAIDYYRIVDSRI